MSESVTRSVFADSVSSALKSIYSAEEKSAEDVFIKERDASIKASDDRVKKMREEAEKLAAQERERAEAAAAREARRLELERASRDRFWATRSRNMQRERAEYAASRASYAASAELRRRNRELSRSTALAGARTRLKNRYIDIKNTRASAERSIQRARDADRVARDAESAARNAQRDLQDPDLTPEAKKVIMDRFTEVFRKATRARDDARIAARAAAKKRREAAEKQRELKEAAEKLERLKELCNDYSWENVHVAGRVGRDISFAKGTDFNTMGQTITKGDVRLTYLGGKTSVSKIGITGRGYRGVPITGWKPKQTYDGLVKVVGDRVGYNKMEKLPWKYQPRACRFGRTSTCRYKAGKFVELHDFNDTGKKYMPMLHNGHVGVMQGDTGKFFSLAENKVIDNPYTSDCQTDLGFK
jgi:hypothetical protein